MGLFTGVFSQFNLDVPTSDLINTDYLVGPELTARKGPWSGRLRVFHESSHLGDELLANNPTVERRTISFEVVDLLVAADWDLGAVKGRVYGGGGRVFSSANVLPPGLVQWGLEVQGGALARPAGSHLSPMAGVDGVSVPGTSYGELKQLRRRIGYVFQDAALLDSLTIRDNLGLRSRTTAVRSTPTSAPSGSRKPSIR